MKTQRTLYLSLILLLPFAFLNGQVTTVLTGSETWSALEELTFDSDASGKGLTEMINTGSLDSTWSTNSQGGKFVTDGSGSAITDGDAGTWARSLPGSDYSPAYSTGKFRLEFTLTEYNLTNFNGMTGVNDLTLAFRDGTTDIIKLQYRIHDDTGSDGIADAFQVAISTTTNGSKFSGKYTGMDSTTASDVWNSMAVEIDFDNDLIFFERNGNVFAGTGISGNDLGSFTYAQFTSIELSANGDWAMSTADTGVISTNALGLYTAVPEPQTIALAAGILALGFVMYRRRRA